MRPTLSLVLPIFNEEAVIPELHVRLQSFLAKLFADGGPLVLPCKEFVPVILGLTPRHEFVKRSDVQDDAIVEVGFYMQIRRSTLMRAAYRPGRLRRRPK